MMKPCTSLKIPWNVLAILMLFLVCSSRIQICDCQADDYNDGGDQQAPELVPEMEACNGVYLSYSVQEKVKEFPHVKNVSAQAWAFKSELQIVNTGKEEVLGWKAFIGFQNKEILVTADGAQLVEQDGLPADVSNGTTLQGYPKADLKTAIETAFDFNQMQIIVKLTGTTYGGKELKKPLPKSIKLTNDGWKCPAATKRPSGDSMYVCCKKDLKYKKKDERKKFAPRKSGDLVFTYDVLQSFPSNYLAQVTIDNNHPLGRLDKWNLTWEWQRGEIIYNMRGAYSRKRDLDECVYGPASKSNSDLDFSQVMSCAKKPVIFDLPPDRYNDTKVGKIPYCCRNGTVLPASLDPSKARAIFQLTVYKMPPDLNRTALTPPTKWNIAGNMQPQYKCGAPVRVSSTEFPDSSGLESITLAVASWQVVCNVTRPKPKQNKCCVSFSSFWNESAIPCNTCACGCEDTGNKCNANARAMLIPPNALLVPFANRSAKALAWAHHLHRKAPKTMPCPDNCGVSINWHVDTDYKNGWTARITLFNWAGNTFQDWFAAVELPKAYPGFENAYSFNGTKVAMAKVNNTIIFSGLKGLNYLVPITNGSKRGMPMVPGKQQSVISFKKNRLTHGIRVAKGDGFPTKFFFNGEECSLPPYIPTGSASLHFQSSLLTLLIVSIVTLLLMVDH